MVESQPSKLLVAGPIPVSRSIFRSFTATNYGTPSGTFPGFRGAQEDRG